MFYYIVSYIIESFLWIKCCRSNFLFVVLLKVKNFLILNFIIILIFYIVMIMYIEFVLLGFFIF